MRANEILNEGFIDFVSKVLGLSWGKEGDVVRGSVVAEYLENNAYITSKKFDRVSKSKYRLTIITPEEARDFRNYSDQNYRGGKSLPDDSILDVDKMDAARYWKLTFDSLMKNPPVVGKDGFIDDGNHRLERAIELNLPKIPVLRQI